MTAGLGCCWTEVMDREVLTTRGLFKRKLCCPEFNLVMDLVRTRRGSRLAGPLLTASGKARAVGGGSGATAAERLPTFNLVMLRCCWMGKRPVDRETTGTRPSWRLLLNSRLLKSDWLDNFSLERLWYSDFSSKMHVLVEVVMPPSSKLDTRWIRLDVNRCGYLRVKATTSFNAKECFPVSKRPTAERMKSRVCDAFS